jgi:hypothetical protein
MPGASGRVVRNVCVAFHEKTAYTPGKAAPDHSTGGVSGSTRTESSPTHGGTLTPRVVILAIRTRQYA